MSGVIILLPLFWTLSTFLPLSLSRIGRLFLLCSRLSLGLRNGFFVAVVLSGRWPTLAFASEFLDGLGVRLSLSLRVLFALPPLFVLSGRLFVLEGLDISLRRGLLASAENNVFTIAKKRTIKLVFRPLGDGFLLACFTPSTNGFCILATLLFAACIPVFSSSRTKRYSSLVPLLLLS